MTYVTGGFTAPVKRASGASLPLTGIQYFSLRRNGVEIAHLAPAAKVTWADDAPPVGPVSYTVVTVTTDTGISPGSNAASGVIPIPADPAVAIVDLTMASFPGQRGAAPPVVVPPVGGQTVYSNGARGAQWQQDFSFGPGAPVNISDTSHPQVGHSFDLLIPASCGWQPVTTTWSGVGAPGVFVGPYGSDISGNTYLSLDLWTANPGHQFDLQAHYDGNVSAGGADVATPTYIDQLSAVVGALQGSTWNLGLKIPAVFLGCLGMVAMYKFFLRDNTGGASFVDNVQWVPGPFSWIYSGGQARSWNGSSYTRDGLGTLNGWTDASVNATALYTQDPSALPVATGVTGLANPGSSTAPTNVLKLSVSLAGGMWKATHGGFSVAPYDHFSFAALPTQAGYGYQVQCYAPGGAPIGTPVNAAAFTPKDWGVGSSFFTVYSIPLSALGVAGQSLGGISIADTSGLATNTVYLSGIGFYA